jgi:hypothetical protein
MQGGVHVPAVGACALEQGGDHGPAGRSVLDHVRLPRCHQSFSSTLIMREPLPTGFSPAWVAAIRDQWSPVLLQLPSPARSQAGRATLLGPDR